ncbi:hypothetical protein LHFGNBLO_001361 [Mesorhizobium sp. AR10]|uniref:hypothetical protein n=1 Tax=Mesorhizobium sp. AR10 TaxID=2865839 RepID=UPI00215EB077|nr:hypothetical protein [Mesorhizobium sp. AR10]UVK39946.1 hypothetical protein LHFGNBLO_001361 [Mesorhizobium sp. AR10]
MRKPFCAGDYIRRRDDHNHTARAHFFFHYGDKIGVVLVGNYDFEKPLGEQEEFSVSLGADPYGTHSHRLGTRILKEFKGLEKLEQERF